ncbi:acyltransferase, partial [Mycobacterium sp. ITM-2017-0098]
HWPVLLMIFWSYVPALGHPVEFGLAGVLISAGLAMVTLRFVETPLRFAPKIRTSPSRSLALGGVATALAVSTGLALLAVTPTPVG